MFSERNSDEFYQVEKRWKEVNENTAWHLLGGILNGTGSKSSFSPGLQR